MVVKSNLNILIVPIIYNVLAHITILYHNNISMGNELSHGQVFVYYHVQSLCTFVYTVAVYKPTCVFFVSTRERP